MEKAVRIVKTMNRILSLLLLALVLIPSGGLAESYKNDVLTRVSQQLQRSRTTPPPEAESGCASLEEYEAYLNEETRQASEYMTYINVPCTKEFMKWLEENRETRRQIDLQAGIVDLGECRADYYRGQMHYSNVYICHDVPYLTSLAELDQALLRADLTQPHTLFFDASPEMRELMKDEQRKYKAWFDKDVISGSHPIKITWWKTASWSNLIEISVYYTHGAVIARAWETGDTSALTEKELKTYGKAVEIMRGLRSTDDAALAREIHDKLCQMAQYDYDNKEERHGDAIGAVLEGKATCAGYADAYYMLCRMAGLDVRVIHGWVGDKPTEMEDQGRWHAWNMIRINGQWRMTDVTWDDHRDGTYSDNYFLLSKRQIAADHGWNECPATALCAE